MMYIHCQHNHGLVLNMRSILKILLAHTHTQDATTITLLHRGILPLRLISTSQVYEDAMKYRVCFVTPLLKNQLIPASHEQPQPAFMSIHVYHTMEAKG